MQSITIDVEFFDQPANDQHIQARVHARNLPEDAAVATARWAASMETGVDMDDLGFPSDIYEECDCWVVIFDR